MQNIKWLYWAWFFLSLFFLVTRFQNTPGVLTDKGVILNDTDPYYRLHRIESIVTEDWSYPLYDKDLSYPDGVSVPWPLGLDLLIAFPLKLYGSTSRAEIASFAAIAIPFFSLPILWAGGALGTILLGRFFGLMLGFLFTMSSNLSYHTGIGRLDHHFLEALFPMVGLFFSYRFLESYARRDRNWLVAILGLAPVFSPQGWLVAPLFFLGVLFRWKKASLHACSKVFFYAFFLSVIPLMFSDRFFEGHFRWISFSWWAPWLYISCGVALELLHVLKEKRIDNQKYAASILMTFFVVMVFLSLTNSTSFIQQNISGALSTVQASQGTISSTVEAQSIFNTTFKQISRTSIPVLISSAICFLFFLYRRKYFFILGYSLIPIILSFFQIRFITLGTPFMLLLILLFFAGLLKGTGLNGRYQKAYLFLFVFLMAIPLQPNWGLTESGNGHGYFKPVQNFCYFLNLENKRLPREEPKSIMAHWDYGHWLLYYTKHAVIADPFQGPTSNEVLDVFTSKGLSMLNEFTDRHPSRYLLIESGAFRAYEWLRILGKDTDLYFNKKEEETGKYNYETTNEFEKLLMSRFFFDLGRDLDGNHPSQWRLLYISPFASPFDSNMSALKVYEKVKGATIKVQTEKPFEQLELVATITERGEPKTFRQMITGSSQHQFQWTVPYGAYDGAGVLFDGQYEIRDSTRNTLFIVPFVSEQQVIEGKTIDVRF